MSILLADIDSTCSRLGKDDGHKYVFAEDSIQYLKVNLFIVPKKNKFKSEILAFDLDFAKRQ